VIHNAVDVQGAPVADPGGAEPLLVSVGRLKYPKDFPTLLDAAARLAGRRFTLEVVGDGPERPELESRHAELALDGRVRLGGERGDVPELLARADVVVLSSRSEGLPVSVIEAMAAGLPVVASSVGGLPELVADGETGILVPAGDAVALADALARLLDDPELRRSYGAAARRRALERFDLARFRGAHLDVYRRELARSGR
jgi:glycosyltransferase involved in cell wall biosynthesis